MTDRWSLLRIWHTEAMESVLGSPDAAVFARTSYAATPTAWRALAEPDLSMRVRVLLDAHYKKHNWQLATSDDPNQMLLVAYDFEWVDASPQPADAAPDVDAFIVTRGAHPGALANAVSQLQAFRAAPRPGLGAKPWTQTFTAWRVDENDTWHLAGWRDREAMFAERFG